MEPGNSEATGPGDREAFCDLLTSLGRDRRIGLLSGAGFWTTRGEPVIGLRSMVLSDGPAGVRGEHWDERLPSVCLPAPVALAATWDEPLVHRVGGLLAAEARRRGVDVVLGPTVNLQRSPLAGRHFECFSEDPLLSGRIGASWVRGLQNHGVAAVAKHYVCNDSETNRFTVDVRVDERTLREVYLAPFERLVVDGGVWAVMAAYNSVNGMTMTESPLLGEPLLEEWRFDGVVVSDWLATRSAEAPVRAGLGLVMPGPQESWHATVAAAVQAGRIPEDVVLDRARRILRLAARVGALEGCERAVPTALQQTPEATAALVRETASASMVLLRNDADLLPLDRRALRRVAVIGPNAARGLVHGGGSAALVPQYMVSPLEGIRQALRGDAVVTHASGVHDEQVLEPMPAGLVTCPDCGEPGFAVRYLDGAQREIRAEHRRLGHLVWTGEDVLRGATVEVKARFRADAAGAWQIGLAGVGAFRLTVDGAALIDEVVLPETDNFAGSFLDPPQRAVVRWLERGAIVDIRLAHRLDPPDPLAAVTFGVQRPRVPADEELASAVDLARTADATVVVVDTGRLRESEGIDRSSMQLPGRQDDLVRAVAAVNPHTVVVVNAGAPVTMPWREDVSAVLVAWFPGQEFGNALADVLLGVTEPGGRLPTTWGARDEDVPVLSTRPVQGVLRYSEGLHVGHRAWLRAGVSPAYPFGHGLGYTTWSYVALDAPPDVAAGEEVTVVVRLRNAGRRAGKEVVQVYLSRRDSAVDRPERWLAGFTVVAALPRGEVVARVRLDTRAFQHWSVDDHRWVTEPGIFRVAAGRSVSDLPLVADVELHL